MFLTNTVPVAVWSNPDKEPAWTDPATVHLSSVVVQDHENHAAPCVKNCTCPILVVGPSRRPRNHHPLPLIGHLVTLSSVFLGAKALDNDLGSREIH
jgi:hypothetical protein